MLKDKLENIIHKGMKWLSMPLIAWSINANAQNIVTGNVESIPSNTPAKAQIIFTNNNDTLQKYITETDTLTGEYTINLPSGDYKQEVLQLEHYYYHDNNFEVNTNRRDTIDVIKAWTPQYPIYIQVGGLWLIQLYTDTFPGDPNEYIETWRPEDRPIPFFLDRTHTTTAWLTKIEEALTEIQNKTHNKVTYQEVPTNPEVGIKYEWRQAANMPITGANGVCLITEVFPDGSLKKADIYIAYDIPPDIITALRENLRALALASNSIDPKSMLASNGIPITGTGLTYEDATVIEYIYSARKVPIDMTKYDTTIVREWVPNAIRINDNPKVIDNYVLEQNYPNPFNNATTFLYSVPKASQIKIDVYDIQGKLVKNILNEKQLPGTYKETWTPENIASGIYIIRMEANNNTGKTAKTRKTVYAK